MHAESSDPGSERRARSERARSAGRDLAALVATSIAATCPALVHGASAADVFAAAAFLLAGVLAPGWVLATVLVPVRGGRFARIGVALVSGLAAQALVFLAARSCGLESFAAAWPLLLVPLWPIYWRAPREHDVACRAGPCVALFAVLALVVVRTPFLAESDWWARQDIDLLFHAGNAAEFARHWPVVDPRVAGEPLVYHLLGYALASGAHVATALPTTSLQTLHFALVGPLALVLVVYAAVRALGGGAWAGVITTALVAAHAEIARVASGSLGEPARWFLFHNDFDAGTFHSVTTRSGLAAFAALVVVGCAWFQGVGSRARLGFAAVLLSAFASGSKGSVMPVVLAGLGIALVVEAWRARRIPWSAIAFLALIAVAALPYTLWLVTAESGYASAMFRFAPMALMRTSGPFAEAARALGHDPYLAPWSIVAACAPLWWIGHHGAAFFGAILVFGRGAERIDVARLWLLGAAVAGILAASLVSAAGHSELFFAYDGHLALAILAGPAVESSARRGRRAGVVVFAIASLVLAAASLSKTIESTSRWLSVPKADAVTRAYRRGLDWIRDESPADAVFVTSGSWTNVSAFGERRTLVESRNYSADFHAARWELVDGRWTRPRGGGAREAPPILVARERFRASPTAENAAAVRAWSGTAPLYLVVDDLRPLEGGPRGVEPVALSVQADLLANSILEPAFANEAVAIYRVR